VPAVSALRSAGELELLKVAAVKCGRAKHCRTPRRAEVELTGCPEIGAIRIIVAAGGYSRNLNKEAPNGHAFPQALFDRPERCSMDSFGTIAVGL
jgi:hypothetical protein